KNKNNKDKVKEDKGPLGANTGAGVQKKQAKATGGGQFKRSYLSIYYYVYTEIRQWERDQLVNIDIVFSVVFSVVFEVTFRIANLGHNYCIDLAIFCNPCCQPSCYARSRCQYFEYWASSRRSTSSESNTSNPSSTPLKSTSHKLSSQEIAGISFGAVAAAAILSLILFALYRRRHARQAATVAAVNNKHGSFPESAWLYDPRMTPAVASPHRSGSPVSSMHSSVSSSASRRDETLLSAIAIPAVLPQRHVSNPVGRALTSNPHSAAKRHRVSSSVPEFKLLPPTPSAAAAANDSTIPSPIAEVTTPQETKRESLPAILKIGGGKKRPLTAAPVMQKVNTRPNKPLPPRPVINAKDRPFSFEAGDDGAQQFGIAK
ncbi:hypothetical protein KCU77_g10897, partial [Aureobasidium melanogenum]